MTLCGCRAKGSSINLAVFVSNRLDAILCQAVQSRTGVEMEARHVGEYFTAGIESVNDGHESS